jgi:hypothetical protein
MRKVMVGLAVLGLAAQAAVAQTAAVKPIQFGVQGSWMSQSVGLGVGGRVVYNALGTTLKVPGLAAYGAFDYFFPSTGTWGSGISIWEINAGATYDVKLQGMTSITPYVGAGLNYAHVGISGCSLCSASSTGLNVLGGGRFKLGAKLNAFAEARVELRTGSAIAFTGGLLF